MDENQVKQLVAELLEAEKKKWFDEIRQHALKNSLEGFDLDEELAKVSSKEEYMEVAKIYINHFKRSRYFLLNLKMQLQTSQETLDAFKQHPIKRQLSEEEIEGTIGQLEEILKKMPTISLRNSNTAVSSANNSSNNNSKPSSTKKYNNKRQRNQ